MTESQISELQSGVKEIFRLAWKQRAGTVVPESDDLILGNEGVSLNATVLYADLDGSTNLVDSTDPTFAAEIYKTYLHCAAKLIRNHGGSITAYDGDRIMAIYLGKSKNTSAVSTALNINYAVNYIINPAIKAQYNADYNVKQVVGIDTSALMATRTGVRGANDLVWVGRAANHAAKLSSLPSTHATRITQEVYDSLNVSVKYHGKESMWESVKWNDMGGKTILRSNWWSRLA